MHHDVTKYSQNSTNPKNRVQRLREICEQLNEMGEVPSAISRRCYSHLYVNDDYKFIFCWMPKLACTNWKRIFMTLSDKFPNKDYVMNAMPHKLVHINWGKYVKPLRSFPKSEIQHRLQTYKKLIFVRDPFERILSAYNDKIAQNDSGSSIKAAKRIIVSKRTDGTPKWVTPQFLEYVKYLTDPDTSKNYNPHWAKYVDLCQPCLIQYDFIGTFEESEKDIEGALKYMAIDGIVQFPKRNISYKHNKTLNAVYSFYKQIPDFYLRKLWQLFKIDYLLFSYPLPTILEHVVNTSTLIK